MQEETRLVRLIYVNKEFLHNPVFGLFLCIVKKGNERLKHYNKP